VAEKRVSIALATYNGERFLAEQLDSFLSQTRLPDELVVGDDSSSDGTLAILRAFAARAPFPVRVVVNSPGLGPAGNFAATIARCDGDVVLLSDQDDIWRPDKIARMVAWLDAHPRHLMVLHDAALVDGSGRALGMTMGQQLEAVGTPPALGLVAGCCMALDRRLARFYASAPKTRYHDAWLTSVADLLGTRGYIAEPLIDYRRHGANVSVSFMSSAERATRWRRLRERIALALAQGAGSALAWSVQDRSSAVAALEQNRAEVAAVLGENPVETALCELRARVARDRLRLAIHEAPRRARPALLLSALRGGVYRGGGGLARFARDLLDAVRHG